MSFSLDIAVKSDEWQSFENIDSLGETAIAAAIAQTGVRILPGAEVSLLLCDDGFIRDLNQKWRGIDKPTNVLSFPAGGPASGNASLGPLLGDIIIAHGTALREAEEEGKRLDHHVAHLIVHGFLHLIGYDHLLTTEAEEMERLERAILAELGIDDPYLGAFVQIDNP